MAVGLFGKLPAHGDFVRRNLPDGFVAPWDAWLQEGIALARDDLGAAFAEAWAAGPAWRFRLPAGACGEAPVAGVLLPSEDLVGRHFPVTVAATLDDLSPPPSASWYDAVEAAARAGRDGGGNADSLLAGLPAEPWGDADAPEPGWWRTGAPHKDMPALLPPWQFRLLLEGGA